MASRGSNLLDVAAQFVFSILGRGCYLGLQVFLARTLGPRDFGLYAIGWTVAGLAGTVAPIGMPQAMLRFGVAGRRALFSLPVVVALASGLVGFVAVVASADAVARLAFDAPEAAPVIVALAPSVPLLCVFWVLGSALRASGRNMASAVVGTLVFVLYFVATLAAFLGGSGRSAVVAGHAYTVAIAASLLPAAWLLYATPPAAQIPGLRPLLRFGVVTMFISSTNLLNLWADRIVIGVMADAKAVGVYQVASQLAVVAIVLRAAVMTVFEARVPKPVAGAAPPDLTREFVAATRMLLHLSAPGLACLCLSAGFWTTALFGPAYAAAAVPLQVLVAGQLLLTFTGPSIIALHMSGKEHTAMYLSGGICVLNIVGNIALIPVLGLAGSALASGVANLAAGVASLVQLRRSGRLQPFLARISDTVLATLASTAAAAMVLWLGGSSLQAAQQVGEVGRTRRTLAGDALHRVRAAVIDDAVVAGAGEAHADVAAHAA